MIEFMDIAREYGVGAALLAMFLPWFYKVDRRSRDNKKALENVHDSCHIPQGAIKELKEEVERLEESEHDLEKRFAVVEESLKEIKADVKTIVMHLTKKAIDG